MDARTPPQTLLQRWGLWADSSDLLHAVTPGSGFRISVVLVNYEWAETGVRPEDGGRVVV